MKEWREAAPIAALRVGWRNGWIPRSSPLGNMLVTRDDIAETVAKTTRTRTKRRSKYITGLLLCSECTRTARKEIVGEAKTQLAGETPQPIDSESGEPRNENLWVRCTKCHNTMLVNLAAMMEEKPKAHANLSASECTPYTPTRIYAIGEAIYHKDWDDVGTVVGKEVTASGRNAVIVQFDKSGEKKLLENFKPE